MYSFAARRELTSAAFAVLTYYVNAFCSFTSPALWSTSVFASTQVTSNWTAAFQYERLKPRTSNSHLLGLHVTQYLPFSPSSSFSVQHSYKTCPRLLQSTQKLQLMREIFSKSTLFGLHDFACINDIIPWPENSVWRVHQVKRKAVAKSRGR